MYVCVFAIGLPIGIGFSTELTFQTVDQIVVSVGPYIFQRDEQRGISCRAKSGGNASPPHRIFMCLRPFHPVSSKSRHVAGVACITVAQLFSNRCPRRRPSMATSRSAITT